MSARAAARSALLGLCLLGAGACVDSRDEPELGKASFIGGVNIQSSDYTESAGPAAPGPVGPAASGGRGSDPDRPATQPTGVAGAAAAGTNAMAAPATSSGGMAAPPQAGAPGPAAGSPAPAAGSGEPPATGPGMLAIEFSSISQGGRYAPRNVGAVWIETADGMFIKTIERWAGTRANHLMRWAEASGGWGSRFFPGGNTVDQMDAVSRATLRAHEAHRLTWDMQDPMGQVVPNGKYKVVIEVADDEVAAAGVGEVAFEKGPMPQTVMAPVGSALTGLVVTYQP